MHEPTILGPTEGDLVDAAGDRYRFLAGTADTNGGYGLIEATVAPGGGPPPHLHTREEEGFYVLEGDITIHVNGREFTAGPGAFVNMPRGSTHWFRNDTDRPARMIIIVAPGGFEQMLREVGTTVEDPATPIKPMDDAQVKRLVNVAPAYGVELKLG